jgi:hypothetical protein
MWSCLQVLYAGVMFALDGLHSRKQLGLQQGDCIVAVSLHHSRLQVLCGSLFALQQTMAEHR